MRLTGMTETQYALNLKCLRKPVFIENYEVDCAYIQTIEYTNNLLPVSLCHTSALVVFITDGCNPHRMAMTGTNSQIFVFILQPDSTVIYQTMNLKIISAWKADYCRPLYNGLFGYLETHYP